MTPLPGNLPYALKDASIDSLPELWRAEFEAEVKDNNFLRGGKSIMLVGPGAEEASRLFLACLLRGGYPAYRITPYEAVRRVHGQPVWRDNDQRKLEAETAECYLIDDLFDASTTEGFGAFDSFYFLTFMRDAIRDGAVLIAAHDDPIVNNDGYSDYVWEFVNENFEVIRAGTSESKVKGGGIKKRKANR